MKTFRRFVKNHPIVSGLIAGGVLVGGSLLSHYLEGRIPRNTVIELDLNTMVFHDKPKPEMDFFNEHRNWVHVDTFVDALAMASEDDRVVALVATVGSAGVRAGSLTVLARVRQAIAEFSKPKLVHVEDLISRGYITYYVLSAFDSISAFPTSSFLIAGLSIHHPFVKNLLTKLDVTAHVSQREEFKTFGNLFSEERFNVPHRQQLEHLLERLMQTTTQAIVDSRGFRDQSFAGVLESGIMPARTMVDANVINRMETRREMYEHLWRDTLGLTGEGEMNLLYYGKYVGKVVEKLRLKYKPKSPSGHVIGLLYLTGNVVIGSNPRPYAPATQIFADDVALQIDALADIDSLKSIVLRLETQGGSAVASEVVRKAIIRAKDAGKKVIVSMGSVAASGGYWIAMSADHILCEPLTITGSIGVIGVHFNFAGMLAKLGVTFDSLATNKHSRLLSMIHAWEEDDMTNYEGFITEMYEVFLRLVSLERNLQPEVVRDLAKGKVYIGEEAQVLNLVDSIGSIDDAFAIARQEAGIPEGVGVTIRKYPVGGLARLMASLQAPKNSRERRSNSLVMGGPIPVLGLVESAVGRFAFGSRVRGALATFESVMSSLEAESRMGQARAVLQLPCVVEGTTESSLFEEN